MAHFAKIEDGIVVGVYAVGDEYAENYAATRAKLGETYIQTSYHNIFRKNYAGIGYTYDSDRDAFIAPEPDGNLGLDEETCQWIMPEMNMGDE